MIRFFCCLVLLCLGCSTDMRYKLSQKKHLPGRWVYRYQNDTMIINDIIDIEFVNVGPGRIQFYMKRVCAQPSFFVHTMGTVELGACNNELCFYGRSNRLHGARVSISQDSMIITTNYDSVLISRAYYKE